jgi:hypothetical protein
VTWLVRGLRICYDNHELCITETSLSMMENHRFYAQPCAWFLHNQQILKKQYIRHVKIQDFLDMTTGPSKMTHYFTSEHQEFHNQEHTVTSKKTWILRKNAVRSNILHEQVLLHFLLVFNSVNTSCSLQEI